MPGNNQPGNTNKGTLKSVPLPVAGVNSFTGNVDPDANTTYYFFLDLDLGDGFDAARMRMTSSTGKDSGGPERLEHRGLLRPGAKGLLAWKDYTKSEDQNQRLMRL